MNWIIFLFSFFVILFTSCETDFDVNAAWEETTVVYGLLDPSNDTQYVRINRAFLGELGAKTMAQYSDSINYNPTHLEVKIHKLISSDTLVSLPFDTTSVIKDSLDINGSPGIFSIENHMIYTVVVPDNFFSNSFNYAITIKNLISGNNVSANTEVISSFSFKNFNSSYKIGFYNPNQPDTSKFLSKTIEWDKCINGEIYQLDVVFNYLENGIEKSIIWNQPLEFFEGSSMNSRIEGVKFLNYISSKLNDITFQGARNFVDLDLIMTVGTEDLDTYLKVNEPITGIVQQRPVFTNITNGIGIFSSRYTYTLSQIDLTDFTKDYLINDLDRNFQ